MPKVHNQSAGAIGICRDHKKYGDVAIGPHQSIDIPDELWNEVKTHPVIQGHLNGGDSVSIERRLVVSQKAEVQQGADPEQSALIAEAKSLMIPGVGRHWNVATLQERIGEARSNLAEGKVFDGSRDLTDEERAQLAENGVTTGGSE